MKLDDILIRHQPAFEYVPDRLGIAAKLLAGMLAYNGDERIDHVMHADDLVNNAIMLTDKLIARIKETQQ